MSPQLIGILFQASTWVLPVLLAVTLHEAAHGWVAWKLGDNTARLAGRVSFNPLRHVDPMGTVILPAMLMLARAPFLFGWAKPVPVNFWNLPNPRRDMAIVAAAGPGINLLQAYIAMLLWHGLPLLSGIPQDWVALNLRNAVEINIILCIFNLIPLPPLDGGRVAVGLLPEALARPLARLERYGMVILLILLLGIPLLAQQFHSDWNPLFALINPIRDGLRDILLVLAGLSD